MSEACHAEDEDGSRAMPPGREYHVRMRIALGAALAMWATVVVARQGAQTPYAGVLDEHPAIQYALRPPHDRVARLSASLASGQVSLPKRQDSGYLRSVLDALAVPVESQIVVFSKTGVQSADTRPDNPRALFFNDSVVVGYIAGARYLEIASHDPEQ